jgi:hypothetical protein
LNSTGNERRREPIAAIHALEQSGEGYEVDGKE